MNLSLNLRRQISRQHLNEFGNAWDFSLREHLAVHNEDWCHHRSVLAESFEHVLHVGHMLNFSVQTQLLDSLLDIVLKGKALSAPRTENLNLQRHHNPSLCDVCSIRL